MNGELSHYGFKGEYTSYDQGGIAWFNRPHIITLLMRDGYGIGKRCLASLL